MQQLELPTVHLKDQARRMLEVFADGRPHPMQEFVNGIHGFTVIAVSQRVREIKKAGFAVENVKPDGGTAVYQLMSH